MTPFENFVRVFTNPKAFFYYFVSACMWFIAVAAITIISSFILTHYLVLGLGLGTALWLYGNGRLLKFFMVSVPEVTGLVAVNLLTGDMNSYGTGLHFTLPWEQIKDGNYINLRTMKTDDKQETFPCEDGPVVSVKWSLQYRSSVKQLRAYIAVDEETINKGLNEVSSSFLATKIRTMKSEAIRGSETKATLEQNLLEHFKTIATVPVKQKQKDGTETDTPLEQFYGISIMLVTIADVDFEADYQKARSTDEIMKKYKETADHIKSGDGSITNKDALDSVLMVAGKGVTKNVTQETKVFDVTPAVAKALEVMAKALSTRGGR